MFDWFEKLVREAIWKVLNDFFHDLSGLAEAKIREKLASLTAGEQLSTTLLIRVLAVDLAADTLRLLVRGAFSFEDITPFMRMEVTISRSEIDLSFSAAPIKVKSWLTVLGDLRIEKKSSFDGELGFGYDHGAACRNSMRCAAPPPQSLERCLSRIIQRILKLLRRTGYLIEEQGMSYLAEADSDSALTPLQAAACTYRIALGPRAGQKVLSLQTAPSRQANSTQPGCVNAHGFEHARG